MSAQTTDVYKDNIFGYRFTKRIAKLTNQKFSKTYVRERIIYYLRALGVRFVNKTGRPHVRAQTSLPPSRTVTVGRRTVRHDDDDDKLSNTTTVHVTISRSGVGKRERASGLVNKLSTPVSRWAQDKVIHYFAIFLFCFAQQFIIWKQTPKKRIRANKKKVIKKQRMTSFFFLPFVKRRVI